MRQDEPPAGFLAGMGGRQCIVTAGAAFESVKEDEQRGVCRAIEEINVDEGLDAMAAEMDKKLAEAGLG